jgi:predicted ATP-grasp superfamily ATP-dependent carboligase
LFIDKQFTYALAETCGVPAPRTLVPHSLVEAVSNAKELGLPCLVKPCQSHLYYERFHRKMVMASSLGQIEEAFCMAMDAGLEVMLQEIIPGDDHEVVNYNTYVCKGQFLPEFTAIHERNAPPWFGSPRVAHSRRIPEVVEPGRRILSKLGFEGYACTEFKRDRRDGTYKLMEINGRHNLSTMLAVTCGINFPWLHYLHLGEGIVPQVSTYREGVYWIDLIRDLGYSGMFLTKERYSLADYLRPYIKSHVFAILDRRDLKPFLKRSLSITCKATRNIFGRAATKSLSPHEKSVLARSAFLKGEGQ